MCLYDEISVCKGVYLMLFEPVGQRRRYGQSGRR